MSETPISKPNWMIVPIVIVISFVATSIISYSLTGALIPEQAFFSVVIPLIIAPPAVYFNHMRRKRLTERLERAHAELEARFEERTRELASAHAQLLQAQKMDAIGQLAGGVAHEFNNYLAVISSLASLMRNRMDNDDPLRQYAVRILEATDRAAQLPKGLLSINRRSDYITQSVDIAAVVKDFSRMITGLVGPEIKVVISIPDGRYIVTGDKGQIEQVLLNLSMNARDAMRIGGTMTISLGQSVADTGAAHSLGLTKPGKCVTITVADTGAGIDASVGGKVFEPFFTTKRSHGTGLGLAVVYGIVRQHGGHIGYTSEPGIGTRFTVTLPSASEDARPAPGAAPRTEPDTGRGETILVAEDFDEIRLATREILEAHGYRVIEASDGDEALTLFARNLDRIDLVLLDLVMPRRNGLEVYKEINTVKPGVKVLFSSGYSDDVISTSELAQSGIKHLPKPAPPEEMLHAIRRMLDAG